eukprot:SAG31_NODE_5283_length_2633_cov_1.701263_1_plen_64_part_10
MDRFRLVVHISFVVHQILLAARTRLVSSMSLSLGYVAIVRQDLVPRSKTVCSIASANRQPLVRQ